MGVLKKAAQHRENRFTDSAETADCFLVLSSLPIPLLDRDSYKAALLPLISNLAFLCVWWLKKKKQWLIGCVYCELQEAVSWQMK